VEIKGIFAPTARVWQPDSPVLYRIVVWLENDQGQPVAARDDTFGQGMVLACQVPLLGRVDASDSSQFDPVAERLVVFLIEGTVPVADALAPSTDPAAGGN